MRERNVVMLALGPLLSELSLKSRIPEANVLGRIIKGIAQIS